MQLNFVEQATFVHISSDFSLVKLNDLESTTGKSRTGASLNLLFFNLIFFIHKRANYTVLRGHVMQAL